MQTVYKIAVPSGLPDEYMSHAVSPSLRCHYKLGETTYPIAGTPGVFVYVDLGEALYGLAGMPKSTHLFEATTSQPLLQLPERIPRGGLVTAAEAILFWQIGTLPQGRYGEEYMHTHPRMALCVDLTLVRQIRPEREAA